LTTQDEKMFHAFTPSPVDVHPALVKTEQLRLSLFFLLSTTGMCNFIRKSCFLSKSKGCSWNPQQLKNWLFWCFSRAFPASVSPIKTSLLMRSAMENAAAAAAAVPDFCAVIFSVVMTTSMLPVLKHHKWVILHMNLDNIHIYIYSNQIFKNMFMMFMTHYNQISKHQNWMLKHVEIERKTTSP
jgi:hypothetical protein